MVMASEAVWTNNNYTLNIPFNDQSQRLPAASAVKYARRKCWLWLHGERAKVSKVSDSR